MRSQDHKSSNSLDFKEDCLNSERKNFLTHLPVIYLLKLKPKQFSILLPRLTVENAIRNNLFLVSTYFYLYLGSDRDRVANTVY